MSKGRLLILGGAAAALLLGGAALALGLAEGLAPLWGFGVACLLLLPGSLSLAARVQDGFSNRGLERERIIGRAVAILQRLVALGLALAAVQAWQVAPVPTSPVSLGLTVAALVAFGGLWFRKRAGAGDHPALAQDAERSRLPVDLAAILLVGLLLRTLAPWGDLATSLALGLRLFLAGQALARATTVAAASCGGCGGGCGC